MKIRRKIKDKYAVATKPDLDSGQYVEFDPTIHFEDSSVTKIYIRKSLIIDVMEWVVESKTIDPVPEVGGFMLGNYWESDVSDYEISLEHFIPSRKIEGNNPIKLHFGTNAMLELEEEKDRFPQYELLGWFHTHPGHTPYLSEQDMTIHNNFFIKKYQIAIVLDSLTQEYNSVLVCRKKNGEVNKSFGEQYWFSWKNLLALKK